MSLESRGGQGELERVETINGWRRHQKTDAADLAVILGGNKAAPRKTQGGIGALKRRTVPLTEKVTVMRTGSSLLYARHYCECLTGGDVGGRASPAPGLKGDSPPEQEKHGGRWLWQREHAYIRAGKEAEQMLAKGQGCKPQTFS